MNVLDIKLDPFLCNEMTMSLAGMLLNLVFEGVKQSQIILIKIYTQFFYRFKIIGSHFCFPKTCRQLTQLGIETT